MISITCFTFYFSCLACRRCVQRVSTSIVSNGIAISFAGFTSTPTTRPRQTEQYKWSSLSYLLVTFDFSFANFFCDYCVRMDTIETIVFQGECQCPRYCACLSARLSITVKVYDAFKHACNDECFPRLLCALYCVADSVNE